MDEQMLKEIIENGENSTVEFKSWVKAESMKERINLVVPELVAFANNRGGTVYFGIEDNGEVTGCAGKYDLQSICEAIYDRTRPPMFTEVEELEYQGNKVISITVQSDGNIYAITDGRCLRRLGKNSKPFYPDEMSHIYSKTQTPDFSEKVFQEALLNALSHRDYQQLGAVYVKHYPDKIVIENPGGFLEGITEKNIITHPSAPRNKLIAETLQRLKYVQRTGQGVDIIFREMVSMGKPYPVYRVFNDAVQLTIGSVTEDVAFVKFIVNEQDSKQVILSLSQLLILRYIVENRKIRFAEAQEIAQISAEDARHNCTELIKLGLIELVGKEYMLTARVYEAVKSQVEYTRDKVVQYIKAKEMILEYLQFNESITNATIRELCGFTKQQARGTIDKMIAEKLIKKIGAGVASRYVLENDK